MRHEWYDTAEACVQRVEHDMGSKSKTFPECQEAVEHPLSGQSKQQMADVIAYLSAQVVGYRHSENAEAKLAMTQIGLVVKDYERRTS